MGLPCPAGPGSSDATHTYMHDRHRLNALELIHAYFFLWRMERRTAAGLRRNEVPVSWRRVDSLYMIVFLLMYFLPHIIAITIIIITPGFDSRSDLPPL